MLSEFFVNFTLQGTQQWPEPQFLNRMLKQKMKKRLKAIPQYRKSADNTGCLIEHFGNETAAAAGAVRAVRRELSGIALKTQKILHESLYFGPMAFFILA